VLSFDFLRYALALACFIGVPAVLLYWLLIHGLIGFWKRLGLVPTLVIVLSIISGCAVGMYLVRGPFMGRDFGTSYPLMALGVAVATLAYAMFLALKRTFPVRILTGAPEIHPAGHPAKLVTEGVQSRIRHPRYAQMTVGYLGYALIANYLIGYLMVAVWIIGIYLVVLLEEKDLRARFGKEYKDYCARVPRFIPNFRKAPPEPK
jgi:protein-S-isoprenylcysteine O-methyltransferase Ste14